MQGLRKLQGGREVLQGVDLSVPSGCVLALLGASGCGKTTLLRVIAGFERADAGRVALDGELVDSGDAAIPAERRRIGYVPQDGSLFPHLSVRGNIGFGLTRAERRGPRIDEMLQLTGLVGLGDRAPHQLSGGQQQRTALARALAPSPRLILLDEPFNALDLSLRRSVCADVVGQLRESGSTAILVTHDPQEAFASADLVAVMTAGKVAQCADPAAVYRTPANAEVARLTGAALFLPGELSGGQVKTVLGRHELAAPPGAGASGRVQVLLRPEQLRLGASGVPVEVIESVFRGDHSLVTILVAGTRIEVPVPGNLDLDQALLLEVLGRVVAFTD